MSRGGAAVLFLTLLAASAAADEPKFEYGKKEDVKKVEWSAQAQAGMILTTGNSHTTTMSGGLTASRKAGDNKFALELTGAFARSDVFVVTDVNGNGTIEENEITRQTITTTKAYSAKLRYDRFFTEHNSAFLTARAAGDKPAGKEFFGGGQIGYSRQLLKTAIHEIDAELGYDYTYESYVAKGDALSIHSARLFVGYKGALSADTSLEASAEILSNLNEESTPTGTANAFDDTRLNARTALTTKLLKDISFRFAFTAKFDNVPAPRPPVGLPYAPGFVPVADKLDTTTEVAVIVNFL